MKMNNWISTELDWNKPNVKGEKLDSSLVFNLINAQSHDEAFNVSSTLEFAVCKNRGLSEAGLNVTVCILASLPSCKYDAKLMCIDLLIEIICSEPLMPNSTVLDDCIEEIYASSWYILNSIEFCKPEDVSSYVDLVCILSIKKKRFAQKSLIYLRKVLERNDKSEINLTVLKNSIDEIEDYLLNDKY